MQVIQAREPAVWVALVEAKLELAQSVLELQGRLVKDTTAVMVTAVLVILGAVAAVPAVWAATVPTVAQEALVELAFPCQ